MAYSPILAPVVALVAWSLVMLVWTAVARRRAFAQMGISWSTIPRGSRGANLDGKAPDEAQWPSHNYNHLMEQPTLFYAIALTLALMNFGGGINSWLAWGYVGLRMAHSLVQATVNIVPIRFAIFALATLCLLGLTVHAAARVIHDCLGWAQPMPPARFIMGLGCRETELIATSASDSVPLSRARLESRPKRCACSRR